MNLCIEGCYKNEQALDALWNEAVNDGMQSQILEAVDDEGDTPIQKCCKYGNPTVLKWVINKWDEEGVSYDLEKKDSDGNPDECKQWSTQ